MKRIFSGSLLLVLFCLVVMSFLYCSYVAKNDTDKKYEAIAGKYVFDMSSIGVQPQTIIFYVNDGKFMADAGDGDIREVQEVAGMEYEFIVPDSINGDWEIEFVKEENGIFNKCRAKNELQKLDIQGHKVKR